MIELDSIFLYKIPNKTKLLEHGFAMSGAGYYKVIHILQGQFDVIVTVESSGAVEFRVMEPALNEEYMPVHIKDAQGGFVSEIRGACEEILMNISSNCFDKEIFNEEQTKRTLSHLKKVYDAEPEFLWKKYPDCAAFRRDDNKKWFAVIMTVHRSKLGLPGNGKIEIIDLKDRPENIETRLDSKKYFAAYHMNKKHWFTVCLDGSISDHELFMLIRSSYVQTK